MPTISTIPAHAFVYNVASTYDISSYVTGAASYEVSDPIVTISDAGVISWNGDSTVPFTESITVTAYESAGQTGESVTSAAFALYFDLPVAAAVDNGLFGWSNNREGTLYLNGGIAAGENDTWEALAAPVGHTVTAEVGGTHRFERPVGETGVYQFRHWDRETLTVFDTDDAPTFDDVSYFRKPTVNQRRTSVR